MALCPSKGLHFLLFTFFVHCAHFVVSICAIYCSLPGHEPAWNDHPQWGMQRSVTAMAFNRLIYTKCYKLKYLWLSIRLREKPTGSEKEMPSFRVNALVTFSPLLRKRGHSLAHQPCIRGSCSLSNWIIYKKALSKFPMSMNNRSISLPLQCLLLSKIKVGFPIRLVFTTKET